MHPIIMNVFPEKIKSFLFPATGKVKAYGFVKLIENEWDEKQEISLKSEKIRKESSYLVFSGSRYSICLQNNVCETARDKTASINVEESFILENKFILMYYSY